MSIARKSNLALVLLAAGVGVGMGLLAAGCKPQVSQSSQLGMQKKPNILWIIAEDASPHIGCYGETAIKTPNLDALAADGVRFQNAYVTAPVCSPAVRGKWWPPT